MADATGLGPVALKACGFESHAAHQIQNKNTLIIKWLQRVLLLSLLYVVLYVQSLACAILEIFGNSGNSGDGTGIYGLNSIIVVARDQLQVVPSNWLKDEELLARGYAQYISQKNGGELLAQLEKDAKLGVGRVFFSKSDEIKSLFDTTIQEVGL